MSINARMKRGALYRLEERMTESGARKKSWVESGSIDAAIYPLSERVASESYRHTESTHAGVTHLRGLEAAKTRLLVDEHRYEVLSVDETHRLTQLSLKEEALW